MSQRVHELVTQFQTLVGSCSETDAQMFLKRGGYVISRAVDLFFEHQSTTSGKGGNPSTSQSNATAIVLSDDDDELLDGLLAELADV